MLRRLIAGTVLLGLLTAWVPTVSAQAQYSPPGPGGVIAFSTASASVSNRTDAVTLFSYAIPPGMIATMPIANASVGVTLNPSFPLNVYSTLPVHLRMSGAITTGATITNNAFTMAVNYGGSTATVALVNNSLISASLTQQPVQIDVWLTPIATNSGTNTVFLSARMSIGGVPAAAGAQMSAFATEAAFNAAVVGTTPIASAASLTVIGKWTTANTLNQLAIYGRTLMIGN